MSSFLILMAVTAVFVFLYGRNKTDSLVKFCLTDLYDYLTFTTKWNRTTNIKRFTRDFEKLVAANGDRLFTDPNFDDEVRDYLVRCTEYNATMDEVNIIDESGKIAISTVKEYEGFDMASKKQSKEFLCLLDGTDVYVQDMRPMSYDDKTMMRYSGKAFNDRKGFIQVGTGLESYQEEREKELISKIRYERVGRTGYYLIVDRDQKIIGSPKDSHNGEELALSVDLKELAESGKIIKEKVYGIDSYIGAGIFDKDIVVVVYPVKEAWETWNAAMIVLMIIYAVVFAVLFILINRLIANHVTKGVYCINDSLRSITDGNLDEKADFRDSVEFDELSDGINQTVDRLKMLIKEAEERIDAELALAAKIQNSFIPHIFPPFPERNEFELYAAMVPAREVGGDFYDYFFIDDDHLALVIGDVSGKGIPAAMFMVMTKDRIRNSVMKHGTDVSGAVLEVNKELCGENDAGMFVTLWIGVLTVSTGQVDYVNAGHEYPAICRAGKDFAIIEDVHSFVVAAMESMDYEAGSFMLRPGDILYQYTDGVTEARDLQENMFRKERLLEALNKDRTASAEDMDNNVRKAVAEFVGEAPGFDDITSVVLKYFGKK